MTITEGAPGVRKYSLNDAYFENIVTERQAYWLGLVAADGSVSTKRSSTRLTLSLRTSDEEHLEAFLADLGSPAPVKRIETILPGRDKEYHRSQVRLSSRKMVADLERWGVGPKKALWMQPPQLPSDLMRHYWRGFVDRDGYIGISRREGGYIRVRMGVVGNEVMCAEFRQWCCDRLEGGLPRVVTHGTIYRFAITGHERCKAILSLLYGDCLVALERKRWRAGLIVNVNRHHHAKRHPTDEQLMAVAKELRMQSTCSARQVGAVLTLGKYIVSYGVNGAPRGISLCQDPDLACRRRAMGFGSGEGLEHCPAVHAEMNCLIQAARNGVATKGTTLYAYCCQPCKWCIGMMINAGVARLVHLGGIEPYDDLGSVLLAESKIEVGTVDDAEV